MTGHSNWRWRTDPSVPRLIWGSSLHNSRAQLQVLVCSVRSTACLQGCVGCMVAPRMSLSLWTCDDEALVLESLVSRCGLLTWRMCFWLRVESKLLQPKKLEPGAVSWVESCEGLKKSRRGRNVPVCARPSLWLAALWLLIRCPLWEACPLSLKAPGLKGYFPVSYCSLFLPPHPHYR